MAFESVKKAPTQRELLNMRSNYRKLDKKYSELRANLIDNIIWDNMEQLSSYDLIELKEVYNQKKKLFWEIEAAENPNAAASKMAYDFLNSMTHEESLNWLQSHHLTTHQLIAKLIENPSYLEEAVV